MQTMTESGHAEQSFMYNKTLLDYLRILEVKDKCQVYKCSHSLCHIKIPKELLPLAPKFEYKRPDKEKHNMINKNNDSTSTLELPWWRGCHEMLDPLSETLLKHFHPDPNDLLLISEICCINIHLWIQRQTLPWSLYPWKHGIPGTPCHSPSPRS